MQKCLLRKQELEKRLWMKQGMTQVLIKPEIDSKDDLIQRKPYEKELITTLTDNFELHAQQTEGEVEC